MAQNKQQKPVAPDCEGNQFARNPYGSNYYDQTFREEGPIPESGGYNHDGATAGEGAFNERLHDGLGSDEKSYLRGADVFGPKDANQPVEARFIDVGAADRGSDDGLDANAPAPERPFAHGDFLRGRR